MIPTTVSFGNEFQSAIVIDGKYYVRASPTLKDEELAAENAAAIVREMEVEIDRILKKWGFQCSS